MIFYISGSWRYWQLELIVVRILISKVLISGRRVFLHKRIAWEDLVLVCFLLFIDVFSGGFGYHLFYNEKLSLSTTNKVLEWLIMTILVCDWMKSLHCNLFLLTN